MLDATLLPAWSLGTIISCWARALQGVLVRITLMFIWPTQISWMIWRVLLQKRSNRFRYPKLGLSQNLPCVLFREVCSGQQTWGSQDESHK
jgi:hypothetical protein